MSYLFATLSSVDVLWVQPSGQSENLEDHMGMFPDSYRFASSKSQGKHFSKWRRNHSNDWVDFFFEVGQKKL